MFKRLFTIIAALGFTAFTTQQAIAADSAFKPKAKNVKPAGKEQKKETRKKEVKKQTAKPQKKLNKKKKK